MQETSNLPAYVPPEVTSFTEEEILEELGSIQMQLPPGPPGPPVVSGL